MPADQPLKRLLSRLRLFFIGFILDTLFFIGLVEGLRHWKPAFKGIFSDPLSSSLRTAFLFLGVISFFLIRAASNSPVKGLFGGMGLSAADRLQLSALFVVLGCELVGFLGFILFLGWALRPDFYVLLAVSNVFFFLLYPRPKDAVVWYDRIQGKP